MESSLTLPKGTYHDRIISPGSEIVVLGWRSNIIVDRCRYLLAAFMKGDTSSGIQVIKVGMGLDSWDTEPPEPPVRGIQQLIDSEAATIPIGSDQMEYLDAAGNPAPGPTHRIRITITLAADTPPVENGETYPLREFGLFGLLDAEEYMIDYVRHPVIHKQAEDTLVRTINLIF